MTLALDSMAALIAPHTRTSAVSEEGHLVTVRAPRGAKVMVDWADRDEPTDITDWLADLIVVGWCARAARGQIEEGAPAADVVTGGQVRLDPPVVADHVLVTYIHLPTREAVEVPLAQALSFASTGITEQVDAGVAHAQAQLADTPSDGGAGAGEDADLQDRATGGEAA